MAVVDRNTLKQWFVKGAKPIASQFAAWIDSFWHKDDMIPPDRVEGLQEVVDELTERCNDATDSATAAADTANAAAQAANAAKAAADTATTQANAAKAAAETATTNANNATVSAVASANAAGQAAVEAGAAKAEAIEAAAIANTASALAEVEIEKMKELEQSVSGSASLAPWRMELDYPREVSVRNTYPQRIAAKLLPSYSLQNVLFLPAAGDAAGVNPAGQLTINSTGETKIHVIPTAATHLYQTVTVKVRVPYFRRLSGGGLRLTSANNLRIF
jgi:hypothetical protein